jgi:hypothetical protein
MVRRKVQSSIDARAVRISKSDAFRRSGSVQKDLAEDLRADGYTVAGGT